MSGVVVVGTDSSPTSDEALRYAVAEAAAHELDIVIVSSYVGPIDPDVDDFETPKSNWVAATQHRVRHAMTRALGITTEQLPAYTVIADDLEPTHLLVRAIQDTPGVQLVVLGQHHEHLLEHLLHGPSRAAALARKTHTPVTIVPQSFHETSEATR